jgi:5-bromo-4-chloroindolyl phosphate hydrolysis protein
MSHAKRYTPKAEESTTATRGMLLYFFLAPLFLSVVLALFQTDIHAFVLNGIAFVLFLGVLTLAKRGFVQEAVYRSSPLAKAPKVPYKTLAGILLGLSTFYVAYIAGAESLIKSLFLALIAVTGYFLYYGTDPKTDKLENLGDISADFVFETIAEAEGKLNTIRSHMQEIHDNTLHRKLEHAVAQAETILKTIQEDPKDIRVARKFLIVYIDGVAKVTHAYTQMEEAQIDEATQARLHSLMDDVQKRFEKELARLQSNNQFDLDVHIDTLKTQINH